MNINKTVERLDLIEELESVEAYGLKTRFIEKWVREGKTSREITELWMECIHNYLYGSDVEEYVLKQSKGDTPHLNYYKNYDLVGDIIKRNYEKELVTLYECGENKRGQMGEERRDSFRGVKYETCINSETERHEIKVSVVDEGMRINRVKTYQGVLPTKKELFEDMIFYLEDEYIPANSPSTLKEIMEKIK